MKDKLGVKIEIFVLKLFLIQVGIIIIFVAIGLLTMMFQGVEKGTEILDWALHYPIKIIGLYFGIVCIGHVVYMIIKLGDLK